jgi:hypothetical protein
MKELVLRLSDEDVESIRKLAAEQLDDERRAHLDARIVEAVCEAWVDFLHECSKRSGADVTKSKKGSAE